MLQGLLERALCSEVCTRVRRSLGGNRVGRLKTTHKRRAVDTLRGTVCFNKLTITLERSYSGAASSPGSPGPAKCTELFINWHEQRHSNSRMSWRPHHQGRRNRERRKAPKAVVSQTVNVAAEASPRSVCFTQSQIHSSSRAFSWDFKVEVWSFLLMFLLVLISFRELRRGCLNEYCGLTLHSSSPL